MHDDQQDFTKEIINNKFKELSKIVGIIFRSKNESVFDKGQILAMITEFLNQINEYNIEFIKRKYDIEDEYLSDDNLP